MRLGKQLQNLLMGGRHRLAHQAYRRRVRKLLLSLATISSVDDTGERQMLAQAFTDPAWLAACLQGIEAAIKDETDSEEEEDEDGVKQPASNKIQQPTKLIKKGKASREKKPRKPARK